MLNSIFLSWRNPWVLLLGALVAFQAGVIATLLFRPLRGSVRQPSVVVEPLASVRSPVVKSSAVIQRSDTRASSSGISSDRSVFQEQTVEQERAGASASETTPLIGAPKTAGGKSRVKAARTKRSRTAVRNHDLKQKSSVGAGSLGDASQVAARGRGREDGPALVRSPGALCAAWRCRKDRRCSLGGHSLGCFFAESRRASGHRD